MSLCLSKWLYHFTFLLILYENSWHSVFLSPFGIVRLFKILNSWICSINHDFNLLFVTYRDCIESVDHFGKYWHLNNIKLINNTRKLFWILITVCPLCEVLFNIVQIFHVFVFIYSLFKSVTEKGLHWLVSSSPCRSINFCFFFWGSVMCLCSLSVWYKIH